MMVQFGDTIYLKAETKREEDEEGFILYVYNINTRTCRPYNSIISKISHLCVKSGISNCYMKTITQI